MVLMVLEVILVFLGVVLVVLGSCFDQVLLPYLNLARSSPAENNMLFAPRVS